MLIHPSDFRAIVSGRRKGFSASLIRGLLSVAEIPYSAAVRLRNWRYDHERVTVHQAGVPVVSVGNLTLGGTGKTPMVEWIARFLRSQDLRVALVSRGYGAQRGQINDEALELRQKLPDVPHVLNPNRATAAREAVEQHAAQVIVLDDGFQHRRLARDLDIVLVDALEPFGFGHVFPRGTLREPLAGWRRADIIVLSRADQVPATERAKIREQVSRYAHAAAWAEVCHAPKSLLSSSGAQQPIDSLAGRRIAAFCGIGNPAAFRRLLEDCGYEIDDFRELPDHCRFDSNQISQLESWAASTSASAIACTQKDLVKVRREQMGNKPLWALSVGLEFLSGEDSLRARLALLAAKARSV